MKAVRYDRYGPAEVLQWVDIPTPVPGPQELLIDVAAAALNPKDLLVRKGKMRLFTRNHLPRGTGYDFSGVVVSRGSSDIDFRPGDEVFGMVNRWDGATCAEFIVAPAREMA